MSTKGRTKVIAILTSLIMAFSVVPFIGGTVYADVDEGTISEDGVFGYIVNEDGATATLTYYYGDYSNLTIPSKIDGYTITEIKSVAEIYDYDGEYTDGVFGDHGEELMFVGIPNTVTSIGASAFSGCYNLVSVKIPTSVRNIGDEAFSECDSLHSITIPSSVENIGEGAFSYSGLTSVTIPKGVKNVWEGAFAFCENLKSVNIQAELNYIWDRSFQWCENLEKITIPKSVKGIGACAFKACWRLNTVNYGGYRRDWKNVTINKYDDDDGTSNGNSELDYANIVCLKYANTLAASGKTVTVKYKKLKKKNQTVARTKVLNVRNNKGAVKYVKSSGNKKITINSKTGNVTVKKKLKKGTYKVKVKVTAAGNAYYKAMTKNVTVTIKVK